MVENEKKYGFMDIITEGLGYASKIISASIFPPIAEGAELVMKTIEERTIQMEKRIMRKISSLLIIGFGGLLLVFALIFFLRDSFGLSNALAIFSIGITIFVIGLLLKVGENDR